MELFTTLAQWRAFATAAADDHLTVGLVPTMGALHRGHEALMTAARGECDVVIVTIFVNPRQFNDSGDLERYPRTLEADLDRCALARVDAVVAPTLEEMWPAYPLTPATTVRVSGVGEGLEESDRPGHFEGVASVVAKLFNLTGRCRAYFGEKDFQQLAVVRQMVEDLAMTVEVVGVPIVRDDDGLALSSRNQLLSEQGRRRALGLSRAVLLAGSNEARPVSAIVREVRDVIAHFDIDVAYATVVDPGTLRALNDSDQGVGRLLVAGSIDGVRLLDNGEVTVRASKGESSAASD